MNRIRRGILSVALLALLIAVAQPLGFGHPPVTVAQWTRFDRVLSSVRSARQYTDFNSSLLASMTAETKHLFNHLVWGDNFRLTYTR